MLSYALLYVHESPRQLSLNCPVDVHLAPGLYVGAQSWFAVARQMRLAITAHSVTVGRQH